MSFQPTFLSLISLCSLASSVRADEPVYLLKQGNRKVAYELACDELDCRPDDALSHAIHFPHKKTKHAVLAHGRSLRPNSKLDLVLYQKGRPRNAASRRVLRRSIIAKVSDRKTLTRLRKVDSVTRVTPVSYAKGWVTIHFRDAGQALDAVETISAIEGVSEAQLLLAKMSQLKSTPNDPLYAYNVANSGYQWHLNNTGHNGGLAGLDLNVSSVWNSYTGSGVKISIVDDGIDVTHPDLNLDTTIDHNWNGRIDGRPHPHCWPQPRHRRCGRRSGGRKQQHRRVRAGPFCTSGWPAPQGCRCR